MQCRFAPAFERLIQNGDLASEDSYLVVSLGDKHFNWFVGFDYHNHPCILIESVSVKGRQPPSIKLENLEVHFHIPCKIERSSEKMEQTTCSVMRLRSADPAIREAFFSVCDSIAEMLGNTPSDTELSKAMRRLAAIFRRILAPPTRKLAGLFGELVLIYQSSLPHELIRDWREANEDRYDFSSDDLKVEVKSTSSRRREHEFGYDQCAPPAQAIGLVASVFVERASRGTSIRKLQEKIEIRLEGKADEIFKLREVITDTLGTAQYQGNEVNFDLMLAVESVKFFQLVEVPAVRGDLPPFVSRVRFVSDLSETSEINIDLLSVLTPLLVAYTKNN